MKSILVELTCPTCLYHTYRKSETLLLSDFETQAREALLEDTFFTLRCPRCGHLIEYFHPLAYVDKEHHFILLMKPLKDLKAKDHNLYAEDITSRKRYISDHTKISEKLHILEDDLDDRVIEILKYRLTCHYSKIKTHKIQLRYHDYDIPSHTIWFTLLRDGVEEHVAVMMEEYKRIEAGMPKESYECFTTIDEAWAKNWIHTAILEKRG